MLPCPGDNHRRTGRASSDLNDQRSIAHTRVPDIDRTCAQALDEVERLDDESECSIRIESHQPILPAIPQCQRRVRRSENDEG